jgi:hypothetical protein
MVIIRGVVLFACCIVTAGCGPEPPRAPALSNERVYSDSTGGFRFLAPEGWIMSARSVPPAGPLPKAILLVHYQNPRADQSGDLHVYAAEVPENKDVGEHIEATPIGPDPWKQSAKPEAVTIGGEAAKRYYFKPVKVKPKDPTREILAFRRGGRVYLFCITYDNGDGATRDRVRTLFDGLRWDGKS